MASILIEVLADQLLSCANAAEARSVLERALRSTPVSDYEGGHSQLLSDLLDHLWWLHAQSEDDTERARLVATISIVQNELMR